MPSYCWGHSGSDEDLQFPVLHAILCLLYSSTALNSPNLNNFGALRGSGQLEQPAGTVDGEDREQPGVLPAPRHRAPSWPNPTHAAACLGRTGKQTAPGAALPPSRYPGPLRHRNPTKSQLNPVPRLPGERKLCSVPSPATSWAPQQMAAPSQLQREGSFSLLAPLWVQSGQILVIPSSPPTTQASGPCPGAQEELAGPCRDLQCPCAGGEGFG